MVYSTVEVINNNDPAGIPVSILSDLSLLESVCINLEHSYIGDLDMFLFAPNGVFLELSTDNGNSGDNYSATCFSPAATQPITYGLPTAPATAAPFTGSFQPEGDWSDLLGTPIAGIWKIGVVDDANGFTGQLLNWSLTFSGAKLGDFHYIWNTGDTTENLVVTEPGIYHVTIRNTVATIKKKFVVVGECAVFTQTTASICPGEAYTFGGDVLTTPGEYTEVIANANGCDTVSTLTLTVLPTAVDTLLVVLPPGESYTYNGQILTQAGTYTFLEPNASGCNDTVYIILTFTSATTEPEVATSLHFSPNPAAGETTVSWDNTLTFQQIRVFDIHGRLVYAQANTANGVRLKTTGWANGWYSVELVGEKRPNARGRLLVRN